MSLRIILLLVILIIFIILLILNKYFNIFFSKNTIHYWLMNKYNNERLEDKAFYTNKLLVKNYIYNNFPEIKVAKVYHYVDNINDFKNINFNNLPKKYVIKATHGSGMNIIITDNNFNLKTVIKKVNKYLNTIYNNGGIYYLLNNEEKHYSKIKPGIIIEEYLGDKIKDYKLFTINGKVIFIQYINNVNTVLNKKINFYDKNWNLLDIHTCLYNNIDIEVKKPRNLEKIISFAENFCKLEDLKYVRVDFMEINDKLYFGEFTFTPDGGIFKYCPHKYNKILYNMVNK